MDDIIELFLLALHGDQSAQERVQFHFSSILLEWFNRHPARENLYSSYDEAHFVDKAFQRIWHHPIDQLQFEFNTLPTITRYLRANLNGVIFDELRAIKATRAHVSPVGSTREPAVENRAEAAKIWERIEGALSSERERRLAFLLLNCGLKPKDIVSAFPQEFSDTNEIVHVRFTVMQLLTNVYQVC